MIMLRLRGIVYDYIRQTVGISDNYSFAVNAEFFGSAFPDLTERVPRYGGNPEAGKASQQQ